MPEKDCKTVILPNTLTEVGKLLPDRREDGHKGTFGKAVVIGGSARYVGAPQFASAAAAETLALCGAAALRCGAGTGTLAVPDFLAQAVYPYVKYTSVFPLSTKDGNIVFVRGEAEELTRKATACAVGMGMDGGDALSYVRYLLDETSCSVVLDADGLKCARFIGDFGGRAVLTPHAGEMAAMTGIPVEKVRENAAEICREYAARKNCVLLLKGCVSHISDGADVYANITGNSALSKGGSGDVLSGITAGLAAWGVAPLSAARLGAYILGRSAELSGVNRIAHLPDDIIAAIPSVFDELQNKR